MSLRVHALDQGSAPILISVETLRRMGAIVDFRDDVAVFTAVNGERLVHLKRSQAGHQLIPLTSDFMHDSEQLSKAVTSLRELVKLPE